MLFRTIPSLLGALAVVAQAAPQVRLGKTLLTGSPSGSGLEFYGGIPFAEPPLGQLRLKPPVLKTRLDVKTFDASNFGKACLQSTDDPSGYSEDCLTINVLRPAGLNPGSRLPVLFWTYGGAFQVGQSSLYNGSAIVAQSVARGTPVIYVNYNYRLGPLGFPQGQEADDRGALNLALKDELAALQWVQANIFAFGGDPGKVTAFGESAGAMMTSLLFLNSPLDKLVRGAILESGSAQSPQEYHASRRQVAWQIFVAGVPSCASVALTNNTFDCLRNANTTDIYTGLLYANANAPEQFPWNPTLDGPNGLFPDIASRLLNVGHFARIPFISGTNLDEGTVFANMSAQTTQDIKDHLVEIYSPPLVSPEVFDSTLNQLLDLYPADPSLGSPYNTGNTTFGMGAMYKRSASIMGDLIFDAQRRTWSQTASRAGLKTYGYQFTQPQTNGFPPIGVNHGSEIAYVYGIPGDTLSTAMVDYWVSFATSLNPNDGKGSSRPVWAPYTPNNEAVLQLNSANLGMIPDTYRQQQLAFIKSNAVVFHQ